MWESILHPAQTEVRMLFKTPAVCGVQPSFKLLMLEEMFISMERELATVLELKFYSIFLFIEKGRKAEPKDGFRRMGATDKSCQSGHMPSSFRRITSLPLR